MTESAARRSPTEWAVLDMLRAHQYDTSNRGSKPDDPGWHVCSCGWEGYWSSFHPHLAERIVERLATVDWREQLSSREAIRSELIRQHMAGECS